MTLNKSISGIRGTIGGGIEYNLNPLVIVKFTVAFAALTKNNFLDHKILIIIGRDSRISGPMVNNLVVGALLSLGIDVLDIGLTTMPTVEMAVIIAKAQGGIMISASHNPKNWNALKFINNLGEFLSASDWDKLLEIVNQNNYLFSSEENIGNYKQDISYLDKHIDKIVCAPLVDVEAIKKANLRVAIDGINSGGGVAIPALLRKIGVNKIEKVHCEPNGIFAHNPEPLPGNMDDISKIIIEKKCDVGFVVDPDVDRLIILDERGKDWADEYTLVSVASYILENNIGNTVSNLSSSRALRDVTEKVGGKYFPSAVGEINVVEKMKTVKAVIGGEGNGGIIYPPLHYGRDALIGVALFLSLLAKSRLKCSDLKVTYPQYYISKNKIDLPAKIDIDDIFGIIKKEYKGKVDNIFTFDGLKLEFSQEWIHLRKSNTDSIIRIYTESTSRERADGLAKKFIERIKGLIENK